MAKDIQSIQRAAYAVIAFMLIFGLGGFGYYTWTGTVVHDPNGRGPAVPDADYVPRYPASASLTVDEPSKGFVMATFRLSNSSPAKLLLPDTAALEPLYAISLRYSPNKDAALTALPRRGQPATVNEAPPAVQADPRIPFDRKNDGCVELIPGSALVRQIGLAQFYDLQKPGRYELTIRYQPLNMTGTYLPDFNVSSTAATVAFELPLDKASNQKAPSVPSVPHAPVPGPAPAPVPPENPNPAAPR